MLGNFIARIRKEKGISKTELSKQTGINVGHLTHIEKGNRKPSHKALMSISKSLGVPYRPLYNTYDKELDETQIEYGYVKHMAYNKIPAISKIDSYIGCPTGFPNAAFAYKAPDNSMSPMIKENSYVFVELSGLLKHKDIGIFNYNNEILIRKLYYKKDHFVLKANDKKIKDITVSDTDDFEIIGKIYM